ncbi:TRAF3-interacting JNK-activating modulator [Chanos chanos]|uniref:TRAF3-interacting JNK-activating modulator n=1 Tax=Chanos chanos TaxID=29144 RepID=A0A6J2WAS9_CHACN|nr:TRAF3-interacting JNK-activating modulator-like [Chanos chanos]
MACSVDNPELWCDVQNYDVKCEQRAIRQRVIGDRNNVTMCRSPTREAEAKWMRSELQRKRQQEFSKRRLLANGAGSLLSVEARQKISRESLQREEHVTQMARSTRRHLRLTQSVGNCRGDVHSREKRSKSPFISSLGVENHADLKQESFIPTVTYSQESIKTTQSVKLRGKASTRKEAALLKDTIQIPINQRTLQTTSMQTESGFVTVKLADIHQLTDYIGEALWREENLKKKISTLQKRTSTLLRSSELLWNTRCDEDLLRSKVKTLESQLLVCMKRVPQDGVESMMLQMEKQRGLYEEKALEAIQRATEEKTEAKSKIENLQEVLQAAKSESVRWQNLCEELRKSSSELRKTQDFSTEQLVQLQNQLDHSRAQEETLREQCKALLQDRVELHSRLSLLEEDNQNLREHLEDIGGHSHETWNNFTLRSGEGPAMRQNSWTTDESVMEQLRETEKRLQMREKECVELQGELEALEQECRSYQSRLQQCREELKQMSGRRGNKRSSSYWLGLFLLMLLFLAVVAATVLWRYHPCLTEQLLDLFSEVGQRVEEYVLQAVHSQQGVCFRPI